MEQMGSGEATVVELLKVAPTADTFCRDILGIDPEVEPERAKVTLRSHLDRARWLSTSGRQRILES